MAGESEDKIPAQGQVLASGGNSEGQLGLGDCEERTAFQTVSFFDSRGPIKMLAAGSNTSAALTERGELFMWGDNTEGQIGLGKENHATTPQEVSVGRPISWVSCGYYHSALVTVDGALYTFGESDSGKLGLGTDQLPRHRVPQRVKGVKDPVTQVACGGGHTVALTEDGVFTFGLGQFGQLGHGTFVFQSPLPQPVQHFKTGRVRQVVCGENTTAVITETGLLYTFGDGRHGKLGLGEENFTNQFKPTLCPRFLKYHVQAATCGGCHMVVLARPRDPSCPDVSLEEGDVTEDYLEKPYVELLGDTANSSTLQRSISARVRRRERERSPDQFGTMFHTLPPVLPGYLHPPLPVSTQTTSPRPPPPQLSHRKLLNGSRQPRTPGAEHQGHEAEGLTDSDSVKGLGETSDFLNMTHVIKMDPGDKTLTLAPVHKRKGENGKATKVQKESPIKERKSRGRKSRESKVASPRGELPPEGPRGHSARSRVSRSPQRLKTTNQNKENLILAMEELQRKPTRDKPSVGDIRKAASKPRLGTAQGKSRLMEVGRKLEPDWRPSPDTRQTGSKPAGKLKPSKLVRVQSKPIAVQSRHAGGVSPPGNHTHSPGQLAGALEEERANSARPPALVRYRSPSKESADWSKRSKKEKNEAQSKMETPKMASKLDLLAGAASLSAGAELMRQVASSQSAVSINVIPESPEGGTREGEKETSLGEKETSLGEEGTSQGEEGTSQGEGGTSQGEGGTSQGEEGTSQGEEGTSQGEEGTSQGEEGTSQGEGGTSQGEGGTSQGISDYATVRQEEEEDEDEEGQTTSAGVSEAEEEEDVSHSIEKVTVKEEEEEDEDEEDEEDSNTLQPEDEVETDVEEEEEEEEEEEGSRMAGSESEVETESKASKDGDAEEEEKEEEEESELEEGRRHKTESRGGESEGEEEEE
ncbi:X-linked retinitis pigmentosa GTPase regulator-like, partial [Etheostoma cragini]|uniref:X-linked retinitis pigmentosa GTPase regulator-like n=1 Tax=Etheostoma cragini TaxID=417921 RepID=UPI00155E483B